MRINNIKISGQDETGLPHGTSLRNVVTLEASIDEFSNAAASLARGELPIAVELGAKLRSARLAKGLTQRHVALSANLPQSTISEIENGRSLNGPNCSTIQKVASVLEMRIDLVRCLEAVAA